MILLQRGHQICRKRAGAAVVFAIVVFQEIDNQVWNISTPLAQRRHLQIHYVDAVEQILAEISGGDLLLQLPVGGAHYPHFHFLVFLRTDTAELAVLQQLQQLGLQGGIEL